ncbi:hypothetical protein BCR39DRAFT_540429 [Naematelia encephala]|uniref:C2 domain-containing protein n=1 Tax=Naematelia encephala TaxID=71784 RepID=A0A1Y2AW23_9TREE|nr:hypothetical protein BCR39DRAFT_540429 [Naematelia encephala]
MADSLSDFRPPLPSRKSKTSASPIEASADSGQDIPASGSPAPSTPPPPPLPPRRGPSPVHSAVESEIPSTPPALERPLNSGSSSQQNNGGELKSNGNVNEGPSPVISVSVTPATPPQMVSPVNERMSPDRKAENHRTTSPPLTKSNKKSPAMRTSPTIPIVPPQSTDDTSKRDEMSSNPSSATDISNTFSAIPTAYLIYAILLLLTLNLAHPVMSPFWLLAFGLASLGYLWLKASDERSKILEANESNGHEPGLGKDAVSWVNHVLYALFPLISTDVLTPFMDLLEDALMEQVPPIVTSVRLTSAALGSQPMLLTSLRPMTDQEWFASISARVASDKNEDRHHKQHQQSRFTESKNPASARTSSSTGKHARSISADTTKSRGSLRRSVSGSSYASMLDSDTIEVEAGRRRKRDRILQGLSRRRLGKSTQDPSTPTPIMADATDKANINSRSGKSAGEAAQTEDGERVRGGLGGDKEEDDPDAGQYVNFQIGFEYKRTESTRRRGWGLHMLAYFGWGVKGVGTSEIPVYIDVISFSGMVNIRLLLSATPPFVRTGIVSLPRLPEFDISAKPLVKAAFNAMELPGMKSYVKASIADVCKAFVRPESFSLDVERLLLGREASLRPISVGVLHIIIHGASHLPKTDTMGSCDPYVTIALSKFNKPVFSTRTIIDSPDPIWEEPAFVLISANSIESGEKLRIRLNDADRFSADDTLGVVEVDLADLIDENTRSGGVETLTRRTDTLTADRPGMKAGGELTWSVKFAPVWQIPEEDVRAKMEERRKSRAEPELAKPWWLDLIERYCEEKPSWEQERMKRRKEALAFFTGEREKDEMEVASKPSEEFKSGILQVRALFNDFARLLTSFQFHIHQCNDLELESLEGTYSSSSDHRKSAAAGRPALEDVVDRTPAENPDPPSAYCEVHLNDRLVYRTRTKQLTPLPYFNAVSERFVRDWELAKIVFVVRDERDREHDPILGLVSMRLKDAFAERSQFTRWFPLVGGLGWGRIRLSLLWKPLDMQLPRGISGYEAATFEIRALASTDLGRQIEKGISLVIETETDKYKLVSSFEGQSSTASTVSFHSAGPRSSLSFDEHTEVDWDIQKPIRLAVEWRHSCSVLFSFITRAGVLKKKKIVGLATTRLDYCPDNQLIERTIPVFATTEVKEVMKAHYNWSAAQRDRDRAHYSSDAKLIGFINLSFVVRPGVSRAHRKLVKKNLRFRHVYEAWETAKECDLGMEHAEVIRKKRWETLDRNGQESDVHNNDEDDDDDNDDDESDTTESDDDEEDVKRQGRMEGGRRKSPNKGNTAGGKEAQLEKEQEEEDEEFLSERSAHSRALHKGNKGIFQLKIARTGKFVKDKLEAKLYSSKVGRQSRGRGQDVEVEHEGQSSL